MNESEKARVASRKKAVKAGAAKGQSAKESRKRYYVQTRVAELEKAGKPVSAEKRKQLREKFNSGNVSRRGFAAPKKRASSSSSSSSSSSVISGTPSSPSSKGRSATSNMKGVSGYKSGSTKSSSMSADSKKSRSGKGKVYDYARNELLGVDDFSRVGKNLKKGNYGKAAKSAGAGLLELGTTAASIFGIGAGAKAALTAGKAAKAAKAAKGASNLKYYKNLGKSVPKVVGNASPYKSAPLSKSAKATNFKYYKNVGKPATKTVSKATKKVAPTAAKRSPRVAKTVSKPLAKSTSKPLTSKAVSKTVVKKVPKKRIK
jgi:hypothetical protein